MRRHGACRSDERNESGGNSATAWYLLADPLWLASLEVAFLGGQDRPTVERADADFNILGVQFRGYIDFGVKEQDWRGALQVSPH
ncbi:MAG: hypothetical protein LBJ67_12485 [Planctomycetaceae bacterium]|jgi:hypothetical protein|nr:hypothetical protein [Planctomycetaceae bacterium]